MSGELPATHAEWQSEELWPDTKIGQGLRSLVIDDERRRQGLSLAALTPELAEAWIFGLADLQGSYANTPLEAIFKRLSNGDLAGAGHLLRRYVAHQMWSSYSEKIVEKDARRVNNTKKFGLKGAAATELDWPKAKQVFNALEDRHRKSNAEAARQICLKLRWEKTRAQAVRKEIAKGFPKAGKK